MVSKNQLENQFFTEFSSIILYFFEAFIISNAKQIILTSIFTLIGYIYSKVKHSLNGIPTSVSIRGFRIDIYFIQPVEG